MVSMWLTESKTKKSSTDDDRALEELLDDVKKRVNGSVQSSGKKQKSHSEIEEVPVDDARKDLHVHM